MPIICYGLPHYVSILAVNSKHCSLAMFNAWPKRLRLLLVAAAFRSVLAISHYVSIALAWYAATFWALVGSPTTNFHTEQWIDFNFDPILLPNLMSQILHILFLEKNAIPLFQNLVPFPSSKLVKGSCGLIYTPLPSPDPFAYSYLLSCTEQLIPWSPC